MDRKCNYIFILLSVFIINTTFADNNPFGARQAAMGNTGVVLTDLWAINHNQAGLAELPGLAAGISYEQRYLISNMGLKAGAFVIPTKTGVFGLSISSFGYSLYSQNKAGIAYARSFGKIISVGLQLNYLNSRLGENYGSKSTVVGEIGIMAKLIKGLSIGAHIYNPSRSKLADYDNERIPTIMTFGAAYKFSDKALLNAEVEKDLQLKPVLKGGMEYHIIKQLYLRAGISTNPTQSCFGFGVDIAGFKLDFASSIHPQLGITPHISISYQVNKKEENKSKPKSKLN